jgi:hypothetical protein
VANCRVSTEKKYNKQNKTHIKKTRQGKVIRINIIIIIIIIISLTQV